MTALQFEALLPHEQTEMALLVRERLEEAGRGRELPRELAAHVIRSHAYAIPTPATPPIVTEGITERLTGEVSSHGSYPKLAAAIIQAIHEAEGGILEATKEDIAARFKATRNGVERAMNNLLDDQLIRRTSTRSQRWTLTVKAQRLIDQILSAGGAA
ncbi:hypothetical protein ABID21_000678 [Pseudorhizobium tarimense]|uniref:ENTH domain-containing protein n=1 Tax=Pseudorhizobium tarimense TaxID=1079109 RepID=A0ABV2H238_9HYPH|nr:hypothetical protein [Pseudorhizobium tarimense]MCJ8517807.1 hypothetical protein [Pseudorhizobium tarimense]